VAAGRGGGGVQGRRSGGGAACWRRFTGGHRQQEAGAEVNVWPCLLYFLLLELALHRFVPDGAGKTKINAEN